MQSTTSKPAGNKHPFGKGAKVTFIALPEPIMTVETIDWAKITAFCRNKDSINKQNNHLTCNPNDPIAVNTRTNN